MKTKLILAIALSSLFGYTVHAQQDISGIGVVLKPEGHAVKIEQVLPNGPASQAHLTNGLIILKIDGTPTDGTHLKKWMEMIRGETGTKVSLELLDPKKGETNTVELVREKIPLPSGPPLTR